MNIAFFTSHAKTRFFFLISKQMESFGYEIIWISNSSTWTKWLLNKGVSTNDILDITNFGQEWTDKNELTKDEELILSSLETSSGLNINNIILMDRLLRTKPLNYARSYLFVAQREIRIFLIEKKVNCLFLEVTHAIELITVSICKEIGCLQFCLHYSRIPGDRFVFFAGYQQSKVVFIREPNDNDKKEAITYYDYFYHERPQPDYMLTNNKLPKFYFNWLSKLLLHVKLKNNDPYDLTRPTPISLVKARLREVLIRGYLELSRPFEKINLSKSKPFVLFTLHHQPESSIDILGSYFSNQIEIIRIISRSLPSTHELYVKEHRVSIGIRSTKYYQELKQIPRVRLIDPFANSHELIQKADLIFTISGTIAYEAALYQKHAITFVPMFFGTLLKINGIKSDYHVFNKKISHLLNNNKDLLCVNTKDEIIDFLSWIIAQSFKGIISDPISNPACMDSRNISAVAEGMNTLLHKQHEI